MSPLAPPLLQEKSDLTELTLDYSRLQLSGL